MNTIRLAVCLVVMAVHLTFSLCVMHRFPLSGDEPHYLMTTHSLLHDGDINLYNNYQNKDYTRFGLDTLSPGSIIYGKDYICPASPWGFSALLVPAYAAGGRIAVRLFIVLLVTILTYMTFNLMIHQKYDSTTSAILTITVMCLPPVLFYGAQMFPEIVLALFVAYGADLLIRQKSIKWYHGLPLFLLPVVHQRGLGLLPLFTLLPLLKQKSGRRFQQSFCLAVPIAAGWLSAVFVNRIVTGSTYPYMTSALPVTSHFMRGLTGLLLDRESGIVSVAPFYAFVFFLPFIRSDENDRRLAWFILLSGLSLGLVALNPQWWGGWSPTGRYFVLFAAPVACSLATVHDRLKRVRKTAFFWLLLFVLSLPSLVILRAAIQSPLRLYSMGNGLHRSFKTTSFLSRLSFHLPSFRSIDRYMWIQSCLVLVIFIGFGALFLSITSRRNALKRKTLILILTVTVVAFCANQILANRAFNAWNERLSKPLSQTPPALMDPPDSIVFSESPPVFRWDDVPGSDGYEFFVMFPSGYTYSTQTPGGAALFAPDKKTWQKMPEGGYTWYVVPLRDGRQGTASAQRRFQIDRAQHRSQT